MHPPPDFSLSVSAASRRPEVATEIHRLYADLRAEIDRRRPICILSGRCCRFDEFGHRLFVTTAEMAAFLSDLRQLAPQPDNPGGCIFQTGKICRVHDIRPLGCRIFFCDATATEWQTEVYERFHSRLKSLHDDLHVPYAYVEWPIACREVGLILPPRDVVRNSNSF